MPYILSLLPLMAFGEDCEMPSPVMESLPAAHICPLDISELPMGSCAG